MILIKVGICTLLIVACPHNNRPGALDGLPTPRKTVARPSGIVNQLVAAILRMSPLFLDRLQLSDLEL